MAHSEYQQIPAEERAIETCAFCLIVDGKTPAHKIYEDAHTVAFLDIHPSSRGHTLIIPKTHAPTLAALDTEEICPLFAAVKTVMSLLHRGLSPEGLTIGWNHGWAAGQQVHHLHVHVIPRYTGDGGRGIQSLCAGAGPQNLAALAAQIRDTSSPER